MTVNKHFLVLLELLLSVPTDLRCLCHVVQQTQKHHNVVDLRGFCSLQPIVKLISFSAQKAACVAWMGSQGLMLISVQSEAERGRSSVVAEADEPCRIQLWVFWVSPL